MISYDKKADIMLTLPRNEAAFLMLLNVIKKHHDSVSTLYTDTAKRLVFDESFRQGALLLAGERKALADVIALLENLMVGG